MAEFPFGSPAQSPQVHGSRQPQGHQVFLRQPIFVPPGTQQAPPQQVQSPSEDPTVSSAGPTEPDRPDLCRATNFIKTRSPIGFELWEL